MSIVFCNSEKNLAGYTNQSFQISKYDQFRAYFAQIVNEIIVLTNLTNQLIFGFLGVCLTLSAPRAIIILSASSVRKEVELMTYIISFVVSVMASVVGNYISKRIDRK